MGVAGAIAGGIASAGLSALSASRQRKQEERIARETQQQNYLAAQQAMRQSQADIQAADMERQDIERKRAALFSSLAKPAVSTALQRNSWAHLAPDLYSNPLNPDATSRERFLS